MKNARPPIFRAPWLPSREQSLAAFRREQMVWRPQAPPAARGYDRAWAELRARHLALEPDCRNCAAHGQHRRAQIVDHIEPIRRAPERRLDPSNLQSLCRSCHQQKTMRERGGPQKNFGLAPRLAR